MAPQHSAMGAHGHARWPTDLLRGLGRGVGACRDGRTYDGTYVPSHLSSSRLIQLSPCAIRATTMCVHTTCRSVKCESILDELSSTVG